MEPIHLSYPVRYPHKHVELRNNIPKPVRKVAHRRAGTPSHRGGFISSISYSRCVRHTAAFDIKLCTAVGNSARFRRPKGPETQNDCSPTFGFWLALNCFQIERRICDSVLRKK